MKKLSLLPLMITALLFTNSYAQVTTKSGTNTSTGTSTSTSAGSDTKHDKVKDEVGKDAASMAKEWTDKMDEICDLDATQQKKIMEINLKYANQLEDLKAKYQGMDNPDVDAAKSEKDAITKQRLKEYSDVLSKEQMQKFKEYRQSQKGDKSGTDKENKKKSKSNS